MTARSRIVLAVLWILSLVVANQWRADAQRNPVGVEVRFVKTNSSVNGQATGNLVANINGQWLPVKLDLGATPDLNDLAPRWTP